MSRKVIRYEEQHRRNIERQAANVERLFNDYSTEAGKIGWAARNRPEPFSWQGNRALRAEAGKVVRGIIKDIEKNVLSAVEVEWLLSEKKNDDIAKELLSEQLQILRQYIGHNENALEAFKRRKIDGLNLSDRLWKLEDKMLVELESAIDVSLKTGTSAQQVAREIKRYLNEPERLYRRVRDERGVLQLSKNAKLFHPGQGVYRSSKANALRLARTEINMAYRTADNLRWDEMDFVYGYEVLRSSNPYECPICEALKGRYPK
jgi:rubrerythrin